MKEKAVKKNPGGRPSTLTDELGETIISSVRKYLSIEVAAEAAETPRSTVSTWITRGAKDAEKGNDSIYAKFSRGIKKARAEKIQDYLLRLEASEKNWQSIAWILERCCAEDFGKDSELYKQLLEDYKMLMQSLIDQNKGVNHGRKEKELG